MSKKVLIAAKSFFQDKQYYKNDVVEFNQYVTDELLKKGLIQLRWRPEVIPLINPADKPEDKPKKKRRPRQTHENMKTKS